MDSQSERSTAERRAGKTQVDAIVTIEASRIEWGVQISKGSHGDEVDHR
jgi:hypothetical protein